MPAGVDEVAPKGLAEDVDVEDGLQVLEPVRSLPQQHARDRQLLDLRVGTHVGRGVGRGSLSRSASEAAGLG